MKQNKRKIIRIIGYLLIVTSLGFFGWDYYLTQQSKAANNELNNINAQIIENTVPIDDQLSDQEKLAISIRRINEEFFAINEDYIGWIEIEGTNINYPMVLGNNNEYYLRHNFRRRNIRHGAIFMDYRNKPDYSDNHTVIYGHSMRDGTMFRALDKYKNQSFIDGHEYISIRTLKGYRTYRIFSVYLVDATRTGLEIPANNRDVQSLISFYKSQSRYRIDTDTSDADHILSLVSCNYDIDNGRIILHAVLVDVNEIED